VFGIDDIEIGISFLHTMALIPHLEPRENVHLAWGGPVSLAIVIVYLLLRIIHTIHMMLITTRVQVSEQ
jgi:hypothetical protein